MRPVRVVVKHQGIAFDIEGLFDREMEEVKSYTVRIADFDATALFEKALTADAKRSILSRADKAAHKQVYGG